MTRVYIKGCYFVNHGVQYLLKLTISGGKMNEFGNYLKELRGKLSLRDVQKGTGISHTYLSTLEKGYDPRTKKQRKPTPEILKKLSLFYGVSYTELMDKAGYINLEGNIKAHSKITGDFTVTKDLFYLLSNEGSISFKNKPLTNEEKEKILIFIEKVLLK
ncbi:helix-turn-helix domain-containing protein [Bacillus sp. OTU2372]|uniref:helix-turn-helix domain-containing protein n=1 Tax=Bacillus sp. OTU2372 TaxID=3043858 RepID=UPI00313CDD00